MPSLSAQVRPDSAQLKPLIGVTGKDTILPVQPNTATVDLSRVKISKDALDDVVDYSAKDSMWFDVRKKQVHLYGAASVKYTSLTVKAGYILLDYNKNEITAEPFPDSSKQLVGLPEFQDGEQNFTASKLRYNFRSKKGIIYEARTKQEDLYVLGERAKFISREVKVDSSLQQQNTIYNKNALITTCDDPHPHFGIRTRKLKVVPDKLVVTGFSNVEIAGIPTPLVLPFGFYPITKTRKAGVIIPRDFEFADREGLGLRDFGWYQPINEHMDATAKFNLYTSGSFGMTGLFNYKQNYKFTSRFEVRYNNRVTENDQAEKESQKSFGITWNHQQDSKAHPSRRFGGSVNIQTNQDQRRNRNDYNSVFQNTLNSNLTFSKTFPGKPYQFNAGLTHSQNTQTRDMNISLPSAAFSLQRIYPFKRDEAIGKERWYEKISFNYNARLENSFRAKDTSLFTQKTLQTARIGIQHQATSDLNFKLFKYITISPNVSYEENWYPYITDRRLLNRNILVYDTITQSDGSVARIELNEEKSQYGVDTTFRNWGFHAFRTYNAGVSANTIRFLTKQFKHGWLRGFRHKITYSASVGFGPNFDGKKYFRELWTDYRPRYRDTITYGIFDDAPFGRPSMGSRDVNLAYSIGNVIEYKYRNAKRDTIIKKRLFDNLVFSGNYGLTRDTLKWSTISTGGLFRLFKGISQLTWSATFDPYITTAKGARINKYALFEQKKLVRTTRLDFALNTGFQIRQLRDVFGKKSKDKAGQNTNASEKHDDLLGWFDDFRIDHRIGFSRQLIPDGYGVDRDTFVVTTNNISFSGDIQLNSKWYIGIGNISYDFQRSQLVYPDLRFTRDLHCWELSLSWQPTNGTYIFSINVKPGSLDFLKVPYRKNNFDTDL